VSEAVVEQNIQPSFPEISNPVEVEEGVKYPDLIVRELFREVREARSRAEAFIKVSGFIGLWKASTCTYFDKQRGFCCAWRLREDAADEIRKLLGDEAVARDDKGFERFRVGKHPFICAVCPLYRGSSSEADKKH